MAYDAEDFKGPNGVNVGEILRVADLVERSATFEMETVYHDCGSPSCIIGHTLTDAERQLHHTGPDDPSEAYEEIDIAQARLGLSDDAADELFMPEHRGRADYFALPLESGWITNAHAAACLRKLAATGEVDWLGTKPAPSAGGAGQ